MITVAIIIFLAVFLAHRVTVENKAEQIHALEQNGSDLSERVLSLKMLMLDLQERVEENEAYVENLKEFILADDIIPIKVKLLHPDAKIPVYAKEGDSGMDISAIEDYTIAPGQTILVKTGLAFGIQNGYEIQVRPRSGVSLKTMLRVGNAPGTVDSSYTGEVCVIITNFGSEPFVVEKGYRIAQIVLAKVAKAELQLVDELDKTDRGASGFGSTGVK